ncbi:hypothetical protein [Cardinium endosymbiont of Oedothorax gibbosus]|uniref:hypothetical protein n=1 Tax=Cardinium endosymbiont of Oedothorax gibbosus TaxID=931101 RepID=UPI002025905D|nr:hypothetical protein [Cardinium endosymbiont of Oedothorax gibbosus]
MQSYKLSKLNFKIKPPATNGDTNISLNKKNKRLPIRLDPDANEVSFELEGLENNIYYHKVTIRYKRIVSLISPKAGGLQIQYVIEGIKFSPKRHKRPIFKEGKSENPVPLKGEREKDKTHVILYY